MVTLSDGLVHFGTVLIQFWYGFGMVLIRFWYGFGVVWSDGVLHFSFESMIAAFTTFILIHLIKSHFVLIREELRSN